MASIQAFWLVAVCAADRTAISPVQLGARSHAICGEAGADAVGVGLVDEDVVGARGRARVVADDLDAGGHRLLEGGRDRGGVVGGDQDRLGALGRRRLDEGDLLGGVGCGRADLRDIAAVHRCRVLGSLERHVEVRVVDLLRDHDDAARDRDDRRHRCGHRRRGRLARATGIARAPPNRATPRLPRPVP